MNRRELFRRAKETMHAALRRRDRSVVVLKAARVALKATQKALDSACDVYSVAKYGSGPQGIGAGK